LYLKNRSSGSHTKSRIITLLKPKSIKHSHATIPKQNTKEYELISVRVVLLPSSNTVNAAATFDRPVPESCTIAMLISANDDILMI
jgi:hypothetical protein